MPFAKLVIIQPGHASRVLKVNTDLVTIGRALDNDVSVEDDTDVSRYHAEIERRGDTFWLIDLQSSNGTTVNDQRIQLEQQIKDRDLICVGGSTVIEFYLSDIPWEERDLLDSEPRPATPEIAVPEPASVALKDATSNVARSAVAEVPQQIPVPATPSAGLSPLYVVGAIGGGLLLTIAVGAILFFSSSGGCKVTARIVSPQSGTTVRGPIAIRVEVEEKPCIDRLIYQLDGIKVASSEVAPYQAMLDPADISGLTPGNHVLTVIIEDNKGNRTIQPDETVLGFEVPQATPSENGDKSSSNQNSDQQQNNDQGQSASAADIKDMSERLVRQISTQRQYIISREMLHQIQTRTTDYISPGYYSRARPFRDVINDSFINEQGLEPPLGYILAMSRSNFNVATNNANSAKQEQGLWRVPLSLAQDAGYLGRCGTGTLSDQNQKCAAMVSAAYLKALEVDLFGGDALYAVVCFGMTTKDAAAWRDQLPADRRDLWSVIKSPEQRERLTRFFAAGIVGENPQQFGLTTDSPVSNLYPKK